MAHPRSFEMFESPGLVDRFLDAGCKQRMIKIHAGGKVLGTLDLSTGGGGYRFNPGQSEGVTESILPDYLYK